MERAGLQKRDVGRVKNTKDREEERYDVDSDRPGQLKKDHGPI